MEENKKGAMPELKFPVAKKKRVFMVVMISIAVWILIKVVLGIFICSGAESYAKKRCF